MSKFNSNHKQLCKKEERANLKSKSISSFSHECKCVLLEYCSSIVFLQNKF